MTLEMSQGVYDRIKQCEAVVVMEYTFDDGRQWAAIGGWGDRSEVEDDLSRGCVVAIPPGGSVERKLVMVADLLAASQGGEG